MKHFIIVGYKSVTRKGAPAKLKKLAEAAKKEATAANKAVKEIDKAKKDLEEKKISEKSHAEILEKSEKVIKASRIATAAAKNFGENMLEEVCECIDCGSNKEVLKEKFNKLSQSKSEFDLIRLIDDSANLKQARPVDMEAYQKELAEKAAKEAAAKEEAEKKALEQRIADSKAALEADEARLKEIVGVDPQDDKPPVDPPDDEKKEEKQAPKPKAPRKTSKASK
jgi:hypothetical protein